MYIKMIVATFGIFTGKMADEMATNKTPRKIAPMDSIRKEIAMIKRFGLFPSYGQPLTGSPTIFYVKYVCNMTVTFLFMASIVVNVIDHFHDSAEVIETLYFGLTEITFVSKVINLHLRCGTFRKLTHYLEEPIFTDFAAEQGAFVKSGVKIVHVFANVFRGAVTMTIVFFVVFPFLDGSDTLLIVPSWFPQSAKRCPFACYLFQLWGIVINGFVHSSHDSMVAGLIMMGSAQFEILKDNLNRIGRNLRVPKDAEEGQTQEDEVLGKIGACVRHHVVTIKYAYEIENMFSPVQFVQFLASSIIICVTGFQIIVTPVTDLKFITLILYFSCNLIQVLMCCWFGHDIMTKSDGVGEACYMSDWYRAGAKVGRSIFIIMERAKRPVTLTAGKFFNLTLQTLMQVLKTSYSYLALLRRMNEVERL